METTENVEVTENIEVTESEPQPEATTSKQLVETNSDNNNIKVEDKKQNNSPSTDSTLPEKSIDLKLHVKHTLIVNGTNAICPIEVILTGSDVTGDLIPKQYDPELFFASKRSKKSKSKNKSKRTYGDAFNQSLQPQIQQQSQQFDQFQSQNQNPYNTNTNTNMNSIQNPPKKRPKISKKSKSNKNKWGDSDSADSDAYNVYDDYKPYQRDFNDNNMSTRRTSARIKKQQTHPQPQQQQQIPQTQYNTNVNTTNTQQTKTITKGGPSKKKEQAQPIVAIQPPEQKFQWVQCDDCMKWRRVPTTIESNELEGNWYCKMNTWDPDHQSCDVAEEDWNALEEQTIEVGKREDIQYLDEKKKFYEELDDFYQCDDMLYKGLSITNFDDAIVGNKILDFYQLYLEVTKRGGFNIVNTNDLWENIFKCLECYSATLSATGAMFLNTKYQEFLRDYEKINFIPNNNNINDIGNDDDNVSNHENEFRKSTSVGAKN